MTLLAGDIGGTKTALAIFELGGSGQGAALTLREERIYPSQEYRSFDEVVHRFLEDTGAKPGRAAFGVAGPVVGGSVRVTNLPWFLDADALARTHGLSRVCLVNDVEANAWGLDELDAADIVTVRPPSVSASGNRVLVSPGTGLGIAGLYKDGERYRPFATEGGHAGFGPETAQERRLLEFAIAKRSRVSWEDVIAGPGLPMLYEFIVADSHSDADRDILEAIGKDEAPPLITTRGLDGTSTAAKETVRLHIRLLGSAAGNAALHYLATGGVYLGGGIVPRLAHRLEADGFLDGFSSKVPMDHLLREIPIRVVMTPKAALLGAARVAADASGW